MASERPVPDETTADKLGAATSFLFCAAPALYRARKPRPWNRNRDLDECLWSFDLGKICSRPALPPDSTGHASPTSQHGRSRVGTPPPGLQQKQHPHPSHILDVEALIDTTKPYCKPIKPHALQTISPPAYKPQGY